MTQATGSLGLDYGPDTPGSVQLSGEGIVWDDGEGLWVGDGFTIALNSEGEYTFALTESWSHDVDSDVEILTFTATATDEDGDIASNDFTITINDDIPSISADYDAILANETGNSVTADLDIGFGADGEATNAAWLSPPPVDGDDHAIGSNGLLTSNDVPLIYLPYGDGGWQAVTHDDSQTQVFTIEVDEDAGEAGQYTVNIVGTLDGAAWSTTVGFTSDNDGITGGNTPNVDIPVDLSGDGSIDTNIAVTGIDQSDDSGLNVNYNNNGMGVAGGSKINEGEALHVEFLDLGGEHQLISDADATMWHFGSDETGYWQAFKHVWIDTDNDGIVDTLDEVPLGDPTPFTSSTVHIEPGENFDTIEFTAAGGTAYGLAALTIEDAFSGIDHTVTFEVVVEDGDGDTASDTFDVTFDGDGILDGDTGESEVIVGGSGVDTIYADDGALDIIDGGEGADLIDVDALDTLVNPDPEDVIS